MKFSPNKTGPGFEDNFIDGLEPINRNDAKHVNIIHTCAGALGMKNRIGTVDFFPNSGYGQPGCNIDATAQMIESFHEVCDHARSWHFYQATVRLPNSFPAIRCNSWDDFVKGEGCYKDDIAFMGFGADVT